MTNTARALPLLDNPAIASIVLSLIAAILFGLLVQTVKRGLQYADANTGTLIIICVASALFWLTSPLWLSPSHFFTPGFWVFCLIGLLHPMLSMYCAIEATARTHASVAATLASTAPLFAAVAAVFLLDEKITLPIAIGTLATVVGIALLSWVPSAARRLMLSAIAFATVAAIVRGATQGVGKYGLSLTYDPPLAAAMSFSVSAAGTALIFWFRGKRIDRIPGAGIRWFVLSGAINGIAIFCMYYALGLGRVTIVAPLIASTPVFTMLFGRLFFGERLSFKATLGILIVASGIVLLSYSATR